MTERQRQAIIDFARDEQPNGTVEADLTEPEPKKDHVEEENVKKEEDEDKKKSETKEDKGKRVENWRGLNKQFNWLWPTSSPSGLLEADTNRANLYCIAAIQ